MATVKPIPPAVPLRTLSGKSYPSCTFTSTTPRTAQLVVIRGRKTPSALYRAGTSFFRNISTTWTMEAMTRMKATVCI